MVLRNRWQICTAVFMALWLFTLWEKFQWAARTKEAKINLHRCTSGSMAALWKYAPITSFCRGSARVEVFSDEQLKVEVVREVPGATPCAP